MGNQPLSLPQPPYQTPVADKNGFLTPAWNKWFQQLYLRIGGPASAPIQNFNSVPLTNLISAIVPNAVGIIYTSPIGQKTVLNSFKVQNTDVVARTISVWLVPQGATYGSDNVAVNTVLIPAGSSVPISALQYQVINGGGTIQALASAPGVLNIIADGRLSS